MVRIFMLCLIMPIFASAQVFYDKPEQGWYWYDENRIEDSKQPPITTESAQAQLEALKKEVEDKKALALMNPTEENLKNYIRIQYEVNQRADLFATTWQKVVIKNPELDYTVKHPTNAVARRVYHQEQEAERKSSIDAFTNKYGLFFFFRSNCPYCHQFAPILNMFEQQYGLTVVPVSLDGKGLPEYPHPKPDNGIASKLNIDIVPAVIAVDPKTGETVPIAYGLVSVDELAYRINLLNSDNQGMAQ